MQNNDSNQSRCFDGLSSVTAAVTHGMKNSLSVIKETGRLLGEMAGWLGEYTIPVGEAHNSSTSSNTELYAYQIKNLVHPEMLEKTCRAINDLPSGSINIKMSFHL